MLVITPTELRQNQSKFLDLAERERVLIKKKNKFIELIVRGESIPETISEKYDYPYSDNVPNEETEQAIRETMQGVGVSDVDTSSREAMLQSLGFYEED